QALRFADVVGRATGDHLARHHIADPRLARRPVVGADTHGDIAIGDRAEHLAPGVADRQKADVLVAHSASGRLHGVLHRDALDVALHDLLAQHGHLPVRVESVWAPKPKEQAHRRGTALAPSEPRGGVMTSLLWLLAAVLLVAWLLGVGGVYTIGS